jgi:hypothetical protein
MGSGVATEGPEARVFAGYSEKWVADRKITNMKPKKMIGRLSWLKTEDSLSLDINFLMQLINTAWHLRYRIDTAQLSNCWFSTAIP